MQCLAEVEGGAGRQRPAVLALVGLQEAVELLQVGHDVVLDVGDGDLQANAAAVEGARGVAGEHLDDHASHHGDDLQGAESWLA